MWERPMTRRGNFHPSPTIGPFSVPRVASPNHLYHALRLPCMFHGMPCHILPSLDHRQPPSSRSSELRWHPSAPPQHRCRNSLSSVLPTLCAYCHEGCHGIQLQSHDNQYDGVILLSPIASLDVCFKAGRSRARLTGCIGRITARLIFLCFFPFWFVQCNFMMNYSYEGVVMR
jgi:hypothetical protein